MAGHFRGRRLVVPRDTRVRPTADRVREAWMSILGGRLDGAAVLDLFAGSGALGLEALSRGARSATFVDLGMASLRAIKENIAVLGLEAETTVCHADALRFAARLAPRAFDVAFADPPYTGDAAVQLAALFQKTPFAEILAVEHAAEHELPGDETRRYGAAAITFFYAPA